MQTPRNLTTLKHLIRDTFRQARASGISWMMLGVTARIRAPVPEREDLRRRHPPRPR